MKVYNRHHCPNPHTTWPSLAACMWPHARIIGDGQYAALSCGARVATLFRTADQARARKYDFDRDGCRDRCYGRHQAIELSANPEPGERRKPSPSGPYTPTPRAEDAAATGPRCGRPRTNGLPCQRPPGWGADPGEKYCKDHGGSTALRTAEAERMADQAETFVRLTAKARTRPLTAREQAQLERAARDVLPALKTRRSAAVLGLAGLSLDGSMPEVPRSAVGSLGLAAARLFLREAEGGVG
ncbi:hypothetical protein [Streptomyces sp. NPDC057403]|uniref:hypothetical protein n=1 Tax=Streptomyces sp. NPDC057403 TaxID=3346119 RepID=UPI00369BD1F6